jgi:hypothetical protein
LTLSWRKTRRFLILDFDCEARPLNWINQDYVGKEVTAIAAQWVGAQGTPQVWLLGEHGLPATRAEFEADQRRMLEGFRELYDDADMVTGHYIRGYDLPLLNGALSELELPPLADKLAHDTKLDLIRRSGLSSSQENLAADLGLAHPKVQMNQRKWRTANRLLAEGLEAAHERVAGDVLQHIELRERLMELGYLAPPKMWRPGGASRSEGYQP